LTRLLSRDASTDHAPDEGDAKPTRWQLELLDQLRGKVDVDLTADATLPLIGQRRATHHFRIPISNGTLNFRRLEKSLSALEDAVLDFAVREGKLVLEKDIPLVPFDRKTLVAWTLDAAERKLADKQMVRLRRLLRFELPRRNEPVEAEPSSVELRELLFDNIEMLLDLGGPARLELPSGGSLRAGSHKEAAIESLRVRGAVRYQTKVGAAEHTTLQLESKRLNFGLDEINIGAHALSSSEVQVAAIAPSKLSFSGARPGSLSTVLRDTLVRGFRFGRRVGDERASK